MGVIVGVDVEGETSSPVHERTDGKPLADIVGSWIWHPSVARLLTLSSRSVEALKRLDESNYGEEHEDVEVSQDPKSLKAALEELKTVRRKNSLYAFSFEADGIRGSFRPFLRRCIGDGCV